VRSFKWETGISAQGIFGPVRNECEGEDVPILSSKKILVRPKVRAENSLGRNSCNPFK
jgi:hypothetical protein